MLPDQSWNWHTHKRIILHFHNCAGVAWTIIPYTFRVENDYFLFKSWNLFIMMCSIPSVILACLLMRLPESPKFLHGQGKHDETIDCLKFVHRWNNRADVKFPVSRSARNTVMQMRCHVYYNRISYTTDCPLNFMSGARPRPCFLQVTSLILADSTDKPTSCSFVGGLYKSTVGLFTSEFQVIAIVTCLVHFCATTRYATRVHARTDEPWVAVKCVP